jgi:[ribosomal protein S18]-alanine N-acetyltransferase
LPSLSLIPFSEEYIDDLYEIEKICYTDPWTRDMLREEIIERFSWIGLYNDKVVGYIVGRIIIDEAEIFSIAVNPEYGRKGFGRELLQSWIQGVKEEGVKKVHLEVRVSNKPAQNLYISTGFVLMGKRKNFYQSPPEDALLFTLEVE